MQCPYRRKTLASIAACWLVFGLLISTAAGQKAVTPAPKTPLVGRAAPSFVLPDTEGRKRALKDKRGRPVALFFFCSCSLCEPVGRLWAEASHDLSTTAPGRSNKAEPTTVVVFAGDAEATLDFARTTGLEAAQATLLVDPDLQVAQSYDAVPCPRVFVLDARGILRYTNNEKGPASYQIPAPTIVSRAVTALRKAAAKSAPANAGPKKENRKRNGR